MEYKVLSNFILRSPLKAFNSYTKAVYNNTLDKEKVKSIFEDEVVSESIFIASPELYEEILKWLSSKISPNKKEEKLIFSLLKYFSRMETRSTPFGLFAGCEIGIISKKTEVTLSEIVKFKRHTRLDMNYLCALSMDLSRNIEIKQKLNYFPNNSLYKSGNKYRYIEYHFEKSKRKHYIISIDKTIYLDKVFERCSSGACFLEMAKCIVDEDISLEDASAYIDELIDNQIIISELEPSTTGIEQLEYILNIIKQIQPLPKTCKNLIGIKTLLKTIDNKGLGNHIGMYDEVLKIIKEMPTSFDKKYLFQTDLILKTDKNQLSDKICNEVKQGITLLSKFNQKQGSNNLDKFVNSFYERYEDREIPLAVALDAETGIGYSYNNASTSDVNPLIDDLRISHKSGLMDYEIKWNILQSFLLGKYREAIQNDLIEVNISMDEIDELTKDLPTSKSLADTFSVMIQIVEADIENDFYKILLSDGGGSTGAYLLGRFCHGDSEILKLVNEITDIENECNEDEILAEIVHLPESRTGNILFRPILRNYEIPYLARASVKEEFQIKLDDLYLSVKNNKIIIRSKRLNKVIIPRLTNAHNYSYNSLPVYQFLCEMQYQNIMSRFSFSWGNLADEHPFLPRMTFNNLILSSAQWNVKIIDLKNYFKEIDDVILLKNIQIWREKNKIPNQVLLSDGDNDLFIDLDVPLYLRLFWVTIKDRQSIKLVEFLYNPKKPLVNSPEGWHTNEVILIFKKEDNLNVL